MYRYTPIMGDDGWVDKPNADRVVVFFHGRGGHRDRPNLIEEAQKIAGALKCSILMVEYRGFGDVKGRPTEQLLRMDGVMAVKYAVVKLRAKEIILWGQSLGTGVAAQVAADLETMDENGKMEFTTIKSNDNWIVQGLVLEAPYISMPHAFADFWMFRWPLFFLRRDQRVRLGAKMLTDTFHTKLWLNQSSVPVLFLHALDDGVIPHGHTDHLMEHITMPDSLSYRIFQHYKPETGGHNHLPRAPKFGETLRQFAEACFAFPYRPSPREKIKFMRKVQKPNKQRAV